jgi:23S rRNA (uracil1939-C5)-methyltransferase
LNPNQLQIAKDTILEVNIDKSAFGGKGIAKIDGFTIFVENGIPQDRVRIVIKRKKKNFAEAKIVKMLEPSPFRGASKCEHFEYCGGCDWLSLKYEKQLEYKQNHLKETIEHIGGIKGVVVKPIIPSDKILGYRNKMIFGCVANPYVPLSETETFDNDFAVGLHVNGAPDKIFDIKSCLLMNNTGSLILEDIKKFIKEAEYKVYNKSARSGFWHSIMLRYSFEYDKWMVNIITVFKEAEAVKPLADILTNKYSEVASVINNITDIKKPSYVGKYEIILAGTPILKEKILGFDFKISANSFFQTNPLCAESLYKTVINYANLKNNEKVIDLYSGAGAIAIIAAASAKEVVGVEIAKSAVKDAEDNCRINGIDNCRFIYGDIKDNLSKIPFTPDVMIIDPPRSGIARDVLQQIMKNPPKKIVYVSCNPASLARDFKLLKNSYNIIEVQPVDMFPNTYHIESATLLEFGGITL